MGFENPGFFLLLSLIIPLIILSMLRIPPKKTIVPTIMIWQKIKRRLPPLRASRGPRFNLPLIIQISAVLCGVLTLVNPFIIFSASTAGTYILIIDNSASMQTLVEGKTRFWHLKQWISSFIDRLSPQDKIILFFEGSKEIAPLTPAETKTFIKRIEPVDCYVKLEDLIASARFVSERYEDPHIILLTDSEADFPDVKTVSFGSPSNNIGITTFTVEEKQNNRIKLFATIENPGSKKTSLPVSIKVGDTVVKSFGQEIERFAVIEDEFLIQSAQREPIGIELEIEDDFSLDNQAWACYIPSEIKIAYSGRQNPYIHKVIRAVAKDAQFHYIDRSSDTSNFDLAIFYECVPESISSNAIVINPKTDFLDISLRPAFRPSDVFITEHPVLKNVQTRDMNIIEARGMQIKGQFEPLFVADKEIIGAIKKQDGFFVVALSFDCRGEDLTITPSFPIFWFNLMNFLEVGAGGLQALKSSHNSQYEKVGWNNKIFVNLLDRRETFNSGKWNLHIPIKKDKIKTTEFKMLEFYFLLACCGLVVISWIYRIANA